jgi:protease secretion system outer membrane protein
MWASSADAIGLSEAYSLALKNDPEYRAAILEKQAGVESKDLGMAVLLPSVSVSANYNKNTGERDTGSTVTPLDYLSQSLALSVRQPLFNLEPHLFTETGERNEIRRH